MKFDVLKVLKIAIISVYLIFVAGSVVRMTGSGMGCPDWPKCFGTYIPPTSEDQITWKAETAINEGLVIIYKQALFVAKETFTTSSSFNIQNWEPYLKHDYAKFNVYHTWTEYINRLSSVLSGFVFLALIILVTFRKEKIKGVQTLVYLAFAGMLFEGWLGKTVVDSNLSPYIITVHMIGGLFIIGFLIRALFLTQNNSNISGKVTYEKTFHLLVLISLLMLVSQILLGTQIRQYVDEQVKAFGFEHKQFRLLNPSFKFYFHRSYTIAIVLINACLFWMNKKYTLGYKAVKWVVLLLGFEAVTGILMYYVNFPFGTQAIHLLSGALLFGVLLHIYFQSSRAKRIA
ncbi:COX15/CtaA family protein [Flavobacteriaceae bacterium]|nr:COX15/CtaA family protein [Flavobacteriaceae bacterium]